MPKGEFRMVSASRSRYSVATPARRGIVIGQATAKGRFTTTPSGWAYRRERQLTRAAAPCISVRRPPRTSCRGSTSPVGLSLEEVRPHSPGGSRERYRVTDLIGTSTQSWEDAASAAIKAASGTLRDLRVAEVVAQDIHLAEDGGITYRTKLRVSFKYEPGE
jgi:flavin-binding protein dodecin